MKQEGPLLPLRVSAPARKHAHTQRQILGKLQSRLTSSLGQCWEKCAMQGERDSEPPKTKFPTPGLPLLPWPGLWVAPVELSPTTPPGWWGVLLERRTGVQRLNYSGTAPIGMGDVWGMPTLGTPLLPLS